MVGYGLILFSLSILLARRFEFSSKIAHASLTMAFLGVLASCCDGIENVFILAMLTNPTGFPNYWAVSHSVFALIKWILLFVVISFVIIFGIFSLFRRKSK
jgi:hypothetical protein